jgi:hypothetical protein
LLKVASLLKMASSSTVPQSVQQLRKETLAPGDRRRPERART